MTQANDLGNIANQLAAVYQQMRLVLNVGGQAGLTGTILYYRYSLDGGATWYDTDAAIQLDGSINQAFWGSWQPIPPMLRQSIDTTVALFGRLGDGATLVELVDWFVLDIRGVDHTSAARLLPKQVTPAEIADPSETELRSFSPKDIADIVGADPVTARPADQSGTSYSLTLADNHSVGEHASAAAITVTVPDRGRGLLW